MPSMVFVCLNHLLITVPQTKAINLRSKCLTCEIGQLLYLQTVYILFASYLLLHPRMVKISKADSQAPLDSVTVTFENHVTLTLVNPETLTFVNCDLGWGYPEMTEY